MPHEIPPYQSPTSAELVPMSAIDEANTMTPHLPSTELVPMRDVYDAYNTVNRANLSPHTSDLSPEDARRINNTYDIELHMGVHGHGISNEQFKNSAPSEVEYAAASAVVDGLQPGDTLFVEGSGFPRQPGFPIGQYPQVYGAAMERRAQQLEESRRNQSINAWEYAAGLAELKGVQVQHADFDALKQRYSMELAQQSTDPGEYFEARSRGREIAARNIVKDYALAHPNPEPNQAEPGRKPKLAVLFGANHQKHLEEAFSDIGLHTETHVMRDSHAERIKAVSRSIGGIGLRGSTSPIGKVGQRSTGILDRRTKQRTQPPPSKHET